jgi:hypothetical protein
MDSASVDEGVSRLRGTVGDTIAKSFQSERLRVLTLSLSWFDLEVFGDATLAGATSRKARCGLENV